MFLWSEENMHVKIKPYRCYSINCICITSSVFLFNSLLTIKICTIPFTAITAEEKKLITCSCTCRLSISCGLILWGLSVLFSILLAFFAVSFRLLDLGVGPPTCPPVVLPPGVQGRRSAVHGPLHVAKVGLAVLAGPIALPPVLPVHINFIMETVVDLTRGQREEKLQVVILISKSL